jgi:hypothetical protein
MERNVARLFRERAAPPSEAHFTQAGLLAGARAIAARSSGVRLAGLFRGTRRTPRMPACWQPSTPIEYRTRLKHQ